MSASPTKKRLPATLEPRKLCQLGANYTGDVPVTSLSRLAKASKMVTACWADIHFGMDEDGRRMVQGSVEASIDMVCQRCLTTMPVKVTSELCLAIVWDEEQAKALPKNIDPWIVGEGDAQLYDMVEEELLLNLPLVPKHEPPCELAWQDASTPPGETEQAAENPFQVLADLKGKTD